MNKIKYLFCPNCHITSIREHPEYKDTVKCEYCGYTCDTDKHIGNIDKKERDK